MLKRYKEKKARMRAQQGKATAQTNSNLRGSPTLPPKVLRYVFTREKAASIKTARVQQRTTSKKSDDGSSVILSKSKVISKISHIPQRTEPDRNAALDDRETTEKGPSAQARNAPPLSSPTRHTGADDQQALWNKKLQEARTFLRSPSPYTGYSFTRRHRLIQKLLHKLSKQKEGSFDEGLYDDVQSWLEKRASETEPERQWDFLKSKSENHEVHDSTAMNDASHSPASQQAEATRGDQAESYHNYPQSPAQQDEGDMLDSDESTSSEESTAGEPQLLLAETAQLQHLMSNQIEKDLSEEAYKPTMPTTIKFALPQAPRSAIEEIKGYLVAEIEKAGYVIAPTEPTSRGKRKRNSAKGKKPSSGKRRRSGGIMDETRYVMDDLINEENALVNEGKSYAVDGQDDGSAMMMSGALQGIEEAADEA